MTEFDSNAPRATRRGFLAGTAGLAALAGANIAPRAAQADGAPASEVEPFYGPHQGGVITPAQTNTYIATFDLVTTKRDDVQALLKQWTEAAAAMSEGKPVEIPGTPITRLRPTPPTFSAFRQRA